MIEPRPPAPVFIVGSLRSGASLLALALSQHPGFALSMENLWLEPFLAGLQRSYRAAMRTRAVSQIDINGFELEDFFAHFGPAAEQLLRGSGAPGAARIVDATPANAFLIAPLRLLFPEARFIHVVRDAPDVVATLTDPLLKPLYKSQSILCSEKEAYDHWLRAVGACLEAEHAYGSEVVLRVRRNDLVIRPEATLGRCLDFLGEPFDHACLRPFSSIPPDVARPRATARPNASGKAPDAMKSNANLLGAVLSEAGCSVAIADDTKAWELQAAMWDRWTRGETLVPRLPGDPRIAKRPAVKPAPKPVARSVTSRLAGLLARKR
jgi:hypothetical protein